MNTTLLIILGVVVVLIFIVVGMYNSLVTLKNRVEEALSDIDVQLKRRYDLIPNLVETVKGYAGHESATLEKVTAARTAAMSAQSGGDAKAQLEAENALSSTLKSIFALSESYPDLKANQNFLELQKELSDTENKIQASRRFYNGNVRDFNTKLQVFPTNMIANMLGFTAREYFEVENGAERENVKVNF
ncbi:LemA family protein [Candidatus Parcubacteria bacterium]|nr:LemA family protein [Patescibacteria group bacterium]MBU4309464.1 LemA family protein [Patescibacteria group bacterium]MBU4432426.1 LemA family protein [Patescibacteria group bacterium]MBU4577825.1 LemA family protein [Patescibacteria group bacterium]MCG2696818.1 LemA family protein [Candidatus Parcubacteria bacterium]